jgi:mannose-1-phosphate guanylyltransferase/mannose-6-phosphate isomerase
MAEILPFILCGGAGTRLWPLSREALPKQFHKIRGSGSLFQQTYRRVQGSLFADAWVLSNQQHRFMIAEQIDLIGFNPRNIVLEPASRNTAPAAGTAAILGAQNNPEQLVLLVPSDHDIADTGAFVGAVEAGIPAAEEGALVTFGVEPDCPHTGYGYIETEKGNSPDLRVVRFVEKPSRDVAEQYLNSGCFYWNAGIFLFKASALVSLFERHAPDILEACHRALDGATTDFGFLRLGDAYAEAPSISLDYAIAEKAENIRCVPLNTAWSDVGSWSAVWGLLEKDDLGNATFGEAEVIIEEARGSLVYSDQALVALVGVENLIVVATQDAVLVASKEHAENVKQVVERLKANGGAYALHHKRVYRPWGWYQGLDEGDRYQVKCIMVKPGGKLSLQSHFHRSEHWVVVRGTLEVTRGEELELLTENQSTYIPVGKVHRLANPGKIPAFLIEVQSGPYLDEDDIVRFEDIYSRTSAD